MSILIYLGALCTINSVVEEEHDAVELSLSALPGRIIQPSQKRIEKLEQER
jgi:hypothetical protein